MIKNDFLKTLLGAALVSAGGEVPLDHVQSLLRDKFEVELPSASNHDALEKYLVKNFSNICRVKKAADGHFVVRVLQLPAITHLLPPGYNEPEYEPLLMTPELPVSIHPPLKKVTPMIPPSQQKFGDRRAMKAATIRTTYASPRPKFSTLFTQNKYQDDPDAASLLANLENQLTEECSVRRIPEPRFTLTTSSGEVFCLASWDSEKIHSHPDVFATKEGAKASVIRKILVGMDRLVEKISKGSSHQSSADVEPIKQTPVYLHHDGQHSAGAPTGFPQEETLTQDELDDPSYTRSFCPDSEVEAAGTGSDYVLNVEEEIVRNTETIVVDPDVTASMSGQQQQMTRSATDAILEQSDKLDGIHVKSLFPNDYEPRINMEQPVSVGYLSHVASDGSFIVQVKGPGLDKWERQSYAFNPRQPALKIVPFRWYVAQVTEGDDVRYEDRAMCVLEDGPHYDENGFVFLRFPDNGYDSFVDPKMVFELNNHDEIGRLPPQGLKIHAIGLTGDTPVAELQVAHPPDHLLLFLPADKSNCFLEACAADVPHVYLYDTVSKRVLC